jgi:hypothetical protein
MKNIDRRILTVPGAVAWLEVIGDCLVVQLSREPRLWTVVARRTDFEGTFTDAGILSFARQQDELHTRLLEGLSEFAPARFARADDEANSGGAA